MAIESARSFVKNFFEDDEFIKELYRKGALKSSKDTTEEEQNQKMVEAAKELGFDFDVEEYREASKEYAQNLGGWKVVKRIFHIGKVIRAAEKEEKKNK